MSEIKIFNNPQFGQIRTSGDSNEPWFCAADVCKALGYANGRDAVAKHVDTPDVAKRDMGVETGKKADGTPAYQIVQSTFVNESGLYALIFGSKLPTAKAFKRWVTSEVLPTIRKTGTFSATVPQTFSEALMLAAKQQQLIEEQQKCIEEKQKSIEEKNRQIEENRPKVVFADAIIGADTNCLIGELAKTLTQNGYKIGQNRLFVWLRQNHYLGTKGEYYNMPYQKYIEQGLFFVDKSPYTQGVTMKIGVTTKVTPKGQQYFINKFLSNQPTLDFE